MLFFAVSSVFCLLLNCNPTAVFWYYKGVINKKESSSQYLADLDKIRKAYVQDVKENYPNNSIPQKSDLSTLKVLHVVRLCKVNVIKRKAHHEVLPAAWCLRCQMIHLSSIVVYTKTSLLSIHREQK